MLARRAGAGETPAPVEPDLHEFMEYVFQPTYGRLKKAMAAELVDKPGWKTIKADSLVLAEAGNLLLIRGPEENRSEGTKYAAAVREFGGDFYRAAQKRDFAAARTNYESMLTNCNACHQQFADGKYQLKP